MPAEIVLPKGVDESVGGDFVAKVYEFHNAVMKLIPPEDETGCDRRCQAVAVALLMIHLRQQRTHEWDREQLQSQGVCAASLLEAESKLMQAGAPKGDLH